MSAAVDLKKQTIQAIQSMGMNFPEIVSKTKELEGCLCQCYGIPPDALSFIKQKLAPLLNNVKDHPIIDQFIAESEALNIDFSNEKEPDPLKEDDGVYNAPDQHAVIFESSYVRILWSTSKPGDFEPFHRHQWKRLILAIRDCSYEVTDGSTGTVQTMHYQKGIHKGEPDEYYACKNLGPDMEECIGFEIK